MHELAELIELGRLPGTPNHTDSTAIEYPFWPMECRADQSDAKSGRTTPPPGLPGPPPEAGSAGSSASKHVDQERGHRDVTHPLVIGRHDVPW